MKHNVDFFDELLSVCLGQTQIFLSDIPFNGHQLFQQFRILISYCVKNLEF